jgi:hypothetical protein
MQRLALMMAVMVLGMPQVHSCHANTGFEMSWGGDMMEPRICPLTMTGEERGISAAGEQDRLSVLHEASPAKQIESAALRGLRQLLLEMEKLRGEREEMQREKLELQRACQLMKEEMQSTHRLQMEMQRACQLMKEEMQSTHQLQMEIQRYLGEVWRPGDDGPILVRVGGVNLPADGGVTASIN